MKLTNVYFAVVALLVLICVVATFEKSLLQQLKDITKEEMPFRSPVIHPFGSTSQLLYEGGRDPLKPFSTKDYLFSYSDVHSLRQSKKSANHIRSVLLSDQKNYHHSTKDIKLKDSKTKEQILLKYDSKFVSGVVNLDNEPTIMKVGCHGEDSVDLYVSNTSAIRHWIPGTIMIINNHWNCFNLKEEELAKATEPAIFRMVIRRELKENSTAGTVVKFHTKKRNAHELFIESKMTLSTTPPERDLKNNLHRPPKDILQSLARSYKNISLLEPRKPERMHKRDYSRTVSYSLDLASFNYDPYSNGPELETLECSFNYTVDNININATFICTDCYTYVSVGCHVSLEFYLFGVDSFTYLLTPKAGI